MDRNISALISRQVPINRTQCMPTPTMLSLRLMLTLVPLLLAVAPAPAGLQARGCGIVIASSDPELQASFERFDRVQSPTATRACALFLNTIPVL
jgi:hypothetical protein